MYLKAFLMQPCRVMGGRRCLHGFRIVVFAAIPLMAITRWSSLQSIPDADFLAGGQFTVEVPAYLSLDTSGDTELRIGGIARLGIIEWVNVHVGYTGGFTFGFKARILGETRPFMPTITIGSRNILSHEEAYYFASEVASDFNNEFFLALAKSIEPAKMRLHGGIMSMPTVKSEAINFFVGIEKYFGGGLYVTAEAFTRKNEFHPSLFVAYRFLRQRLELSAGLVELRHLMFDDDDNFSLSLDKKAGAGFIRPAIYFGLKFNSNFSGKMKGKAFTSMEARVDRQSVLVDSLIESMVALKDENARHKETITNMQQTLSLITDSVGERGHLKSVILGKMMELRTLYNTTPFEPEKARNILREVVGYRRKAIPVLKEIISDQSEERFARILAVSALGEIGERGSSDVLLDVVSRTEDPDLRVEILIALGKMNETRAMYLFEQLANDPNDAVAFTAQEMLQKLVNNAGVRVSKNIEMRDVVMPESLITRERPVDTTTASTGTIPVPETDEGPSEISVQDAPPREEKETADEEVLLNVLESLPEPTGNNAVDADTEPVVEEEPRGEPEQQAPVEDVPRRRSRRKTKE